MKTIFVSIASYKDPEVLNTVNELLTKQSGKNELHICVFSQIDLEDDSFDSLDSIPEVQHVKYDYRHAKGVCWARAQIQKYYAGEDYYLQIDSHIIFEQDWDLMLIEDHRKALSYGKKAIITIYPPPYEFNSEGERTIPMKAPTRFEPHVVNVIPSSSSKFCVESDMPEMEYFIAAGFLFSTGDIVENVPYDEELYFFGEEITFAIRAYTADYLLFSPSKFICAHLYQDHQKKDEKRPVVWEENEDIQRRIRWWHRERTGRIKTVFICRGEWFGKYGIHNHDLYIEFAKRINIAYPNVDLSKVAL